MTVEGWARLSRVLHHPAAPRWSHTLGDQLTADDLAEVQAFRAELADDQPAAPSYAAGAPPPALLARIAAWIPQIDELRGRIPVGFHLERDWAAIRLLDRSTVAERLATLIPANAPIPRMMVYTTTGTTGHALDVPSHPRTVAMAHLFAERVLSRLGLDPKLSGLPIAAINLCAQRDTFTFATSASVWEGSVFAKVNLDPRAWCEPGDRARFLVDLNPPLLTSDPLALAALLELGLPLRPRLVLCTALGLHPGLQATLRDRLGCPIVDWYSTTETGPIAAGEGGDLELLSPDMFVEVVDAQGQPLPEGTHGELVVSGGRNPFLPLVRYRTGDRARLLTRADGRRVLRDLEGRRAVPLYRADGSLVNPVDVARSLRLNADFVQQQTVQHPDGRLTVRIRPIPGTDIDVEQVILSLQRLFYADTSGSADHPKGPHLPIEVVIDPRLGDLQPGGKVLAFIQERETAPDRDGVSSGGSEHRA